MSLYGWRNVMVCLVALLGAGIVSAPPARAGDDYCVTTKVRSWTVTSDSTCAREMELDLGATGSDLWLTYSTGSATPKMFFSGVRQAVEVRVGGWSGRLTPDASGRVYLTGVSATYVFDALKRGQTFQVVFYYPDRGPITATIADTSYSAAFERLRK
jgi:hypothetical protein